MDRRLNCRQNPKGSAHIVKDIYSKTDRLLSANPFVGEIAGTRELVISRTPYIVAYRVTDTHVEVLFVQHGAQQWPEEA